MFGVSGVHQVFVDLVEHGPRVNKVCGMCFSGWYLASTYRRNGSECWLWFEHSVKQRGCVLTASPAKCLVMEAWWLEAFKIIGSMLQHSQSLGVTARTRSGLVSISCFQRSAHSIVLTHEKVVPTWSQHHVFRRCSLCGDRQEQRHFFDCSLLLQLGQS